MKLPLVYNGKNISALFLLYSPKITQTTIDCFLPFHNEQIRGSLKDLCVSRGKGHGSRLKEAIIFFCGGIIIPYYGFQAEKSGY